MKKKTKPSPDQDRHMMTRAQVEELASELSDHPTGAAFREMLASSDQQEFEIWLPKGYVCSPS